MGVRRLISLNLGVLENPCCRGHLHYQGVFHNSKGIILFKKTEFRFLATSWCNDDVTHIGYPLLLRYINDIVQCWKWVVFPCCGSGGRAGRPMIERSAVRIPAPPVHMSKCPWARHWTPHCLQWVGRHSLPPLVCECGSVDAGIYCLPLHSQCMNE